MEARREKFFQYKRVANQSGVYITEAAINKIWVQ